MKRILYWLTSHLPCRIISDDGKPYLERYYLCTVFGVRFYLHRFVGSDPAARGLHDHPWRWARSVVLSGWYCEYRPDGMHKVRWFNKISGDTFHRVVLPVAHIKSWASGKWCAVDEPCWTLFFHDAEYVKPWGFMRAGKWQAHNHPKDGRGTPDAWWKKVPNGKYEPRRATR